MTNFESMKSSEIESHFASLIAELFSSAHDVNITEHQKQVYISFEYEGVNYAITFKRDRAQRVEGQLRAMKKVVE